MQSDLVFRGAHQECAHNSKKISRFAADLVFRDIQGSRFSGAGTRSGSGTRSCELRR